MTDLEITRLCAEAMGVTYEVHPIRGKILRYWFMDGNTEREFNPLYNDAQAMALVKQMQLFIMPEHEGLNWAVSDKSDHEIVNDDDLNRAICECVAKMQTAKK